MKQSRKRKLKFRHIMIHRDAEGVPGTSFSSDYKILNGEVWPASGKLQIETYGNRLNGILNCRVEGSYKIVPEGSHVKYVFDDFWICEGDAVHIYTDDQSDPDYMIVAIRPYTPLYMEVERL